MFKKLKTTVLLNSHPRKTEPEGNCVSDAHVRKDLVATCGRLMCVSAALVS